ncbi:phosphomannomutase/phosphoglucomutase [Legionella spiritensis]|uniref:phosphomannomutase/phosphoglucomutase n=1 Tax=Legionella spiritensis TaxID=452 RepID=UPI000F7119F8|nr:phosphomannomutase/phosphoglucomutase [Legionella spiritensis]VEG92049.1 phosphomannomutase [Legionella spiritensis]
MNYRERLIDRTVFRAYDIRGVIGDQLDVHAFYTIGKAVSCRLRDLQRDHIFVARDGRLTSESLCAALAQGLVDSGIHVVDLGMVASPVLYYATHVHGIDCGLIVTGSHNPAEYNGIKIVLAGKTLVQKDIDALFERVRPGHFQQGAGTLQSRDIIADYMARIVTDISLARPLKVVVDCGNGVAGPVIPEVMTRLGCDVVSLYCEVDGRFPNHHPDPTIEANLRDLKEEVVRHQADIGLAFDGDADRLGVVTELGEVIWPDRLMMFYALDLLQGKPGATIVFDVKCSSHLASVIEEAGGVARMCPTGHSIVKSVMREENAALAGEMSGHLFFKDRWYGFDDALYSACRLLEIISRSPLPVSEQFHQIPNGINTPEIKIPIADDEKFLFMQRFSEEADFPDATVISIDGLRVEFPCGWGLLRASNTTPCLVARFEADDEKSLELIKNLFKTQLHKINGALPLPF